MVTAADNITGLIGNTPLLKLNRVVPEGAADVYVKLEFFNPGGSVKDRIALAMIEDAEYKGVLKPGGNQCQANAGVAGRWLNNGAAWLQDPFIFSVFNHR